MDMKCQDVMNSVNWRTKWEMQQNATAAIIENQMPE